MQARNWLLGGVVLAGLAVASLWLLWLFARDPEVAVAAPPIPPAGTAAAPASATSEGTPAAADPAASPGEVSRREAATPAPEGTDKHATLRGRCVDGTGVPLAGRTVKLDGWNANEERVEAWRRDHAKPPDWQDPPAQTTGAEGVFSFVFWPPPPFQFVLRIARDGCGAITGRWSKIDEGARVTCRAVGARPLEVLGYVQRFGVGIATARAALAKNGNHRSSSSAGELGAVRRR